MKALFRTALALATLLFTSLAGAGTVTYYYNDLAGSPVVATDASGTVLWRESYQPYGARTRNEAPSAENKVWFTSRRQDAETGLVYMGARYYDPVVGRFVSTDPVGFDEANIHSFNRYAYANNNPYKYVDPDGNVPILIPLVAAAVRIAAQRVVTFALTRGAQTTISATEIAAGDALGAGSIAAGAVAAERAIAKAGDIASAGKVDFVASVDGAVVHASPSAVRDSLESAGFKGFPISSPAGTEVGTLHNIPGMRMDARVMDGGTHHRPRVVTTREGTSQPVNPATGGNFGNIPKAEQRQRSHIEFP